MSERTTEIHTMLPREAFAHATFLNAARPCPVLIEGPSSHRPNLSTTQTRPLLQPHPQQPGSISQRVGAHLDTIVVGRRSSVIFFSGGANTTVKKGPCQHAALQSRTDRPVKSDRQLPCHRHTGRMSCLGKRISDRGHVKARDWHPGNFPFRGGGSESSVSEIVNSPTLPIKCQA